VCMLRSLLQLFRGQLNHISTLLVWLVFLPPGITRDPTIVPSFKVYLIRHGESEANLKAEFVSGRSNHVNLTETGTLQAKALGQYLSEVGIKFDKVFFLDCGSREIYCQTLLRGNEVPFGTGRT